MGSDAAFIGQYASLFFGFATIPVVLIDCITGITILVLWILLRMKRLGKHLDHDIVSMNEAEDESNGKIKAIEKGEPLSHKDWSAILLYAAIWMLVFTITWFCIILCMWRAWPVGAAIPVTTVFLWISWTILLPLPSNRPLYGPWNSPKSVLGQIYRKIRGRPALYFCGLIGFFLVVFIPSYFGYGICVSTSVDPITITTTYSRSREVQYCANPGVCHVYLTLPRDTSTGVIVNVHTKELASSSDIITVYLDVVSRNGSSLSTYSRKVTGKSWAETNCDGLKRGIHWIDVSGLSPDTTYYFRAGLGSNENLYSQEKKFKTLSDDSNKITFITGGDLGLSEMTKKMMIVSAAESPDFALIGGDIAYANAMSSCYRLWDLYLLWWEQHMVTPSGYYIPQILAIGNHEAGGYGTFVGDIPHFLAWFPQEFGVGLNDRSTYHAHFLGTSGVVMALDSAITTLSEGTTQADWMSREFSTTFSNCTKKFTVYHVPLYPSYRTLDGFPSAQLRDIWVPVFDKFDLTIGFENHDHAYKRTKPLKNSQVDPKGTVYVGDGAWGVPIRPSLAAAAGRYYLDYAVSKNFVVKVDMLPNAVNITAIDDNKTRFDQYSRSL
eukprot:TRINITY_DN1108_c0_g1_i1.p1 TRINITY_DN1108_c0_g1~~TRINITY_DN1108_c0_g1_i1.p1  ORF type:complete len:608 (-),score=192.35 TRINITY_DN1108_c0_g1_i1:1983-3806(-)